MEWFWRIPWVRRHRRRIRLPVQAFIGFILAPYIRFVIRTSTVVAEPPDYMDRKRALRPYILAFWHGQFLLAPGLHPPDVPGRAMVARHDDAPVALDEPVGQAVHRHRVLGCHQRAVGQRQNGQKQVFRVARVGDLP